jgi:hypothetical protein
MPNLKTNRLLEESVVVIIPREIEINLLKIEGFWNTRIKPFNVNNEYFKEVSQTLFLPILGKNDSSKVESPLLMNR